jgi:predicted membrane protein
VPGGDAGRHRDPRIATGPGVPGGYAPSARVVFGLVVIALGVLFTLDNLGLVSAGRALSWWPAVLVLFGVMRLTGTYRTRNVVLGTILTLAGGLLLLHEAGVIAFQPWDFWPAVLVVIGGSIVIRALRRAHGGDAGPGPAGGIVHASGGGAGAPAGPGDAASTLSTIAVWAGIERKVTSVTFRGGDVTAIMGGAEIDLRPARMEGGHAVLDVTVLWGGVDLYVPADWRVSVEALPLLAGIEDSTQAPAGEARGHLVVRGVVLMGGLEVKN